ncbi:ATP-dependent DNA ligase, partial [Streptomyces sp. SID5926]|nr:ATP-dependent DNA ligase [Streptomyces sp. SID5926]
MRAGRHTVEVHRPDKVLFPAGEGGTEEYTKGDLVDYHRAAAPFMLPHLRGRPLMLERHPDGVDGPRFMQKNTPEHYPEWIDRVEVGKEGGTVCHTVCDDSATLAYLADQAALTLHRWLSRTGRLDRPDRMVFDLDPA